MSAERRPDTSGASVHSQEQQQSGMPPMGMPPQDGPSPRSGQPSYPGSAPYPPPSGPPGGYNGPSPPPPQPYAAAQQTQSYQPPPQGSFPPQGFPPYGMFPPHMFHPGAPPPFGQQPPFYGFPGYPSQYQRIHDEKSGGRRKSPTRRNRSPRRSYNSKSIQDEQQSVIEIELPSVKPMKSAFHFFAQEMMDSLQQAAEDEVRKTNNGQVDLYLVNTNLNGRLIKEWEDASQILREEYMEKEEEDRKRFMADDEIASRHCATLTARARSPQFGKSSKKGQKEYDDDDEEEEEEGSFGSGGSDEQEKKRDSPTENGESPTKKIRTDEDEVNGEDEAIAAV